MIYFNEDDIPKEYTQYFEPVELGLEPNFNDYINKLCNTFDEVKRVLRKDGTLWVNIGDTYNSLPAGNKKPSGFQQNRSIEADIQTVKINKKIDLKISDKSLCNIPARFSIEMQNRGWILRNVIIWYKPNCMPSSVKDRFTVDFEYVYFFVKNKKYWFEQQIENKGSICERKRSSAFRLQNENTNDKIITNGRNKRTVWKVTTKPYKEAHFATYPKELIEPMIKAGCPVNGLVLDPFFGSGTTGLVALEQNKKFMGIELNPSYIEIAKNRLNPLLTQKKLFGGMNYDKI